MPMTPPDDLPVGTVRQLLLALVAFGAAGLLLELCLLDHHDSVTKWIPLVLLGLAFPICGWVAARPGPSSLRVFQAVMWACVLAGGLGADLDVGYPGDGLEGVWNSLPFIEGIKTAELPEVGERVAVIGGGNTAIDVVREAVRLGARDVTLVYRRTEAEMPAYAHEVEEAREEGVKFLWLTLPVRFLGEARLTGVECRRMELGPEDESGRRRPVEIPGSEFVLPVDTVVKAIGQQSRDELADWVDGLVFVRGQVDVDTDGRTGNPRFFCGGDAVSGGTSVVEAVRDGKRAAAAIDWELRCRS